MPVTDRHWRHKQRYTALDEEEISFTRLRARCDVMADRSDRERGQPNRCPRRHSLINRMGPCSRTPSGPAVSTDCINRPDRGLHPTNAIASIYLLQRGSHPQRTSFRPARLVRLVATPEVATGCCPRSTTRAHLNLHRASQLLIPGPVSTPCNDLSIR